MRGSHVTRGFLAILALWLGLCLPWTAALSSPISPGERNKDARFSISIMPQMELLTAVQTQTSWSERVEPRDSNGNAYYRAVKEFMSQYKDHRAVKVCQQLLDRGFSYDAPPTFILHLGPLPDLDLAFEYSDYIVRRAGGKEKLEEFRLDLKALAHDSDFLGFLSEWQQQFDKWIEEVERTTDLAKVVRWWEDFTGMSAGDEYHIVLCPGTFYNNYGPRLWREDIGGVAAYNIAAASTKESEDGGAVFGSAFGLESLSIHEIGHSFVNPALEPFDKQLASIYPIYKVVESKMRAQAYTNIATYLNEQVIRAAQAIAEEELHGPERREVSIQSDESRGFHMTSFIVEQLEEYATNRDTYPKFTDFIPVLLDRLAEQAQSIQARMTTTRVVLFVAALAVLAGVWFIYRKRRSAAS